MKFLAVAALLASAVSAATSAAAAAQTTSACAAQNILDACLETENNLLESCGTNDWDCKCNAYGNIVTCYNNCPSDEAVDTAKGQQQIFCGYASQYPSATPTAAATTAATTATAGATATGTATDKTGTDKTGTATTGTATGTATSATETNSGADLVLNAGSMLVAVAGMVAALL